MVDLVSVVICTYDMDRYPSFSEAIESVRGQTYEPIEIVLVIDGNEAVYERTVEEYGDVENVFIYNNEENRGISYSRTRGGELASGDVVAFIDDDGVAEPDWIETLVEVYETSDAIAAGGDVRPNWQTEKPSWFPEEFYWLVGVVEPGFAEDGEEVRNVYGCNISYRREAFLEVGGYDPKTGRKGDKHLQAHEAPVGIRLLEEYGKGMVFVEDAVVNHTLFDYRADFRWLVSRSFWQGYSKRILDILYPTGPDNKGEYLSWLIKARIPKRLNTLISQPSLSHLEQFVVLNIFTTVVGLGYFWAVVSLKFKNEAIDNECVGN